MRIAKLLFLVILVSTVLFAQERVAVFPTGDVVPLEKSQTVLNAAIKAGLIAREQSPSPLLTPPPCPSSLDGGRIYNVADYNNNLTSAAGDAIAMIYVVPFSGNISAIHWEPSANSLGNTDATMRIYKASVIGGRSTATYWGYYPDSNDVNIGVGGHIGNEPFPEEATGAYVPGEAGTHTLFGPALWGAEIGGFPITWPDGAAHQVNVNMMDLGYEPAVTAGDTIIIVIRKEWFTGGVLGTTGANIAMNTTQLPPSFRCFKYYYNGRLAVGDPGWWAREFELFIWFTITVSGDVPPTVTSSTTLNNTLSTTAQPVTLTAYDCNIAVPADTGVASAAVHYAVDGGAYTTVPMSVSSFVWSADVPGQPIGSTVAYYYTVTDIHGFTTTTSTKSYRVIQLSRANYVYSAPTYSFTDIAGAPGATEIQPADWQGAAGGGNVDDGTAGPIAIGGNFNFFGRDTMQTIWVSANGGLSVTDTSTDTIWVNSSGTRTGAFTNFDIPGSSAPRNFIPGFWNDLWLGPDGHGSVWYKQTGTQLIVQWNRVGNFNAASDTTTTFQIVLDRSDNSVTYNYMDVGSTGLNLQGLTGIQASSTNDWVFVNRYGYPTETQPHNSFTMKLTYNPSAVRNPDAGLPAKFALHANYPNPFNPTTKIAYDIPSRSHVELSIYNLLGEKVADLVSDVQDAGTYSATWDGRNLQGQLVSSGVYLYRLKAGNYLDTKKMVLLK